MGFYQNLELMIQFQKNTLTSMERVAPFYRILPTTSEGPKNEDENFQFFLI